MYSLGLPVVTGVDEVLLSTMRDGKGLQVLSTMLVGVVAVVSNVAIAMLFRPVSAAVPGLMLSQFAPTAVVFVLVTKPVMGKVNK